MGSNLHSILVAFCGAVVLLIGLHLLSGSGRRILRYSRTGLMVDQAPPPISGGGAYGPWCGGQAILQDSNRTADDFLRAADVALYSAKHAGRDCVVGDDLANHEK